MSRPIEILLKRHFDNVCKVYAGSFAHSYRAYKDLPIEDFTKNYDVYKQMLVDVSDEFYRVAAASINRYLQTYDIHANKTVDEFKIIYFIGRAIEAKLIHIGYIEIARVHMFTLAGLLDYRLRTLGLEKKLMMRAMCKLILLNQLDREMGQVGFYMAYKCVATTIAKPAASAAPPLSAVLK